MTSRSFSVPSVSSMASVVKRSAALIPLAVSLTACQSPFRDAPLTQPQLTEDLKTIRPADLTDYVDQETNGDTPEPTPPVEPAELQLTLEQLRVWVLEDNLELRAQLIAPAIATQDLSAEEARFEAVLFGGATLHR